MKKICMFIALMVSYTMVSAQTNPSGYVDLGLPSGTLWKSAKEQGVFSYNTAVRRFGNSLPTDKQMQELISKCRWNWTGKGYKVTGPNGNSIFLSAAGSPVNGKTLGIGDWGYYWTSTEDNEKTAWLLQFDIGSVRMTEGYSKSTTESVILVYTKKSSGEMPIGYVDLGLPSGTLWSKANEKGKLTFDDALQKYELRVPSKGQWKELIDNCTWTWEGNGYTIKGTNGNSLFLPAPEKNRNGNHASYWSSSTFTVNYSYCLSINSDEVHIYDGYPSWEKYVRLVCDSRELELKRQKEARHEDSLRLEKKRIEDSILNEKKRIEDSISNEKRREKEEHRALQKRQDEEQLKAICGEWVGEGEYAIIRIEIDSNSLKVYDNNGIIYDGEAQLSVKNGHVSFFNKDRHRYTSNGKNSPSRRKYTRIRYNGNYYNFTIAFSDLRYYSDCSCFVVDCSTSLDIMNCGGGKPINKGERLYLKKVEPKKKKR